MKEIILKELSIVELESFAYKTIVQIQQLQATLNALEGEIASRPKEEQNLKAV